MVALQYRPEQSIFQRMKLDTFCGIVQKLIIILPPVSSPFPTSLFFIKPSKLEAPFISLHLFSMWFLNQNLFHRLCQISLLLSLPHRIQISPSDPLGRNNFSAFPKPFLPPRSTLDQCPPSSLPWQLLPSSLFLLWPLTTQWYVIIIAFIGSVVDKALSCDFCKLLRWVRRLFLSPQREQKLSQSHIANGNTGLSTQDLEVHSFSSSLLSLLSHSTLWENVDTQIFVDCSIDLVKTLIFLSIYHLHPTQRVCFHSSYPRGGKSALPRHPLRWKLDLGRRAEVCSLGMLSVRGMVFLKS